MSKNEGKGLKSFNKGFQVPDTYIIIFFVVVFAALMTFLVPKGFYETQDISYMINGVEKTRTVIKDGSFQYLTDDTECTTYYHKKCDNLDCRTIYDSVIHIVEESCSTISAKECYSFCYYISCIICQILETSVFDYCTGFLLVEQFLEWEKKHFRLL